MELKKLSFVNKLFEECTSLVGAKKIIKDKDGMIGDLNDKITVLRKSISDTTDTVRDLEKKNLSLNSLREEDADLIASYSKRVKGYESNISKLDSDNRELQETIKNLQEALAKASKKPVEKKPSKKPVAVPTPKEVAVPKNTTFTKKEVEDIFKQAVEGKTTEEIADALNSKADIVQRVISGETYSRYGLFKKYSKKLKK